MASSYGWILVADGSHARFFSIDRPRGPLQAAVASDLIHDRSPSRELTSDRPGRSFDSTTPARHAMEEPTDPHRHEKQVFAREIVAILDKHYKQQAFEHLYLVAPPTMLGDIRAALGQALSKIVAGDLAKDFTRLKVDDLASRLQPLFDE